MTEATDLRGDLVGILGEDRVLTDRADRLAYNADCSPRGILLARGRRLDAGQPSAIVQPDSPDEICTLTDWAARTNTPLVAYGDGSGVCRGAVGDADSVVVDLKRFDALRELDANARSVTVGAGMNGYLFERELQRRGWTAGHFPSSIYCSSVGGWVAARGAGQLSSRYGKIEDIVESMRVVTGRGEVIDTATAGPPDPTQWFVGSEGTLGFITDVTLKVEPEPTQRHYRGFQFDSLADGIEAIRRLMQTGLRPAVVRFYDPFDTLVKRASGGGSEGLKSALPGALRAALEARVEQWGHAAFNGLIKRAEWVNGAVDAFSSECRLIVGFEGHAAALETEADIGFDVLRRFGIDLGVEPGEDWRASRYDVSYKQSPVFDAGAFVDTMEVATNWSNLQTLYDRVREALAPHVLVMAHFSHVYPAGSSIYFTFVGSADSTDDALQLHQTAWRRGLDAVDGAGGSIAHHHGVGSIKAAWTARDHRGGAAGFRALKEAFDPDRILNPGTVYPRADAAREASP
jgi:alkyldihydroxyacetonephosphate synthase